MPAAGDVPEQNLTIPAEEWSFPGVTNDGGSPVRAGRFMDPAELRAGLVPDDPEFVAEAMLLNDFYPAHPAVGRSRATGRCPLARAAADAGDAAAKRVAAGSGSAVA